LGSQGCLSSRNGQGKKINSSTIKGKKKSRNFILSRGKLTFSRKVEKIETISHRRDNTTEGWGTLLGPV